MREFLMVMCLLWLPVAGQTVNELEAEEAVNKDSGEDVVWQGVRKLRVAYYAERELLRDKYRAGFADVLDHADTIEVFLLGFEPVPRPDTFSEDPFSGMIAQDRSEEDPTMFRIRPYFTNTKILQRKKLSGEESILCKKLTKEVSL